MYVLVVNNNIMTFHKVSFAIEIKNFIVINTRGLILQKLQINSRRKKRTGE